MTIAQEWLEAAYNRSSQNDPGKLAQDPELLAHLDRIFQRFFALYAKARPDEAASMLDLVLVSVPAFAAVPAGTIAIVRLMTSTQDTVHLIPASERRKLWHVAPSMYRVGDTIYSRSLGGDPLAGDTITALVLDPPASLVALTSVIDARFPSRHAQVCIDALAVYLDTKDDGRDGDAHAKLMGEYQTALASFASEYELPPSALEWAHAPVQRSSIGQAGAQ